MVVLPRFAPAPFRLLTTPAPLQEALEREYSGMTFNPVETSTRNDPAYQAEVIAGISSVRSRTPDLGYAPMSEGLMELAYDSSPH